MKKLLKRKQQKQALMWISQQENFKESTPVSHKHVHIGKTKAQNIANKE